MPDLHRVLIIDDNRELVRAADCACTSPATKSGRPTTASRESRRRLSGVRAIVLDVQMPHKDGLIALTELKACEVTAIFP